MYISNHYINLDNSIGYNVRRSTGEISTSKFINTLDYSLDLIKLREIYERVYRNSRFGFFVGDKEYTQRLINVTFKYALKEYNRPKDKLYVKNGWSTSEIVLNDCVCVHNGEIVAVQTDTQVNSPVDIESMCKYFYKHEIKGKDDEHIGWCYRAKHNIANVKSVSMLRDELYENGFNCDGIHYVRFKRSSGSSRVGKCLFIDEKLYDRMKKWDSCGIKIHDGQEMDLAAWEAYIALTSSSIIDTLEIYPENILVVDDFESTFEDEVIATRVNENSRLVSKKEKVKITNSIWDGQSLLDESFFGHYTRYGMLLLRNRFFKSACFNTNIQQFFKEHNITEVSQLNGYTRAKHISDIRLITTPSSIKYLKFGTLDKWLDNLEPLFGIVKHEKPTHYFDGTMVQTHYQLLNSIQLSYEEMEEFLKPQLDYIRMINCDPAVLRYHIKYPDNDEWFLRNNAMLTKNDIVYSLLGMNEAFAQTKLYSDFRYDLVKSLIKNVRNGHVLVNGNYSTLFGNPLEMLYWSIGQWDGKSIIGKGNIYSIRFADGAELLGCRSPHIAAGNIMLAKNIRHYEMFKYFNMSNEIVAINSIGENTLQKLNGADYPLSKVPCIRNGAMRIW